jgi:hypothetical protein
VGAKKTTEMCDIGLCLKQVRKTRKALAAGATEILKMAVFWEFAPCILVEEEKEGSASCLHHQGDE